MEAVVAELASARRHVYLPYPGVPFAGGKIEYHSHVLTAAAESGSLEKDELVDYARTPKCVLFRSLPVKILRPCFFNHPNQN